MNFADDEVLETDKARSVQSESRLALISCGTILSNAQAAAKILEEESALKITVIDARFAKPFDEKLFIEQNSQGKMQNGAGLEVEAIVNTARKLIL